MQLSFLVSFVLSVGLTLHPFHVSVCEIDYNQTQNSLEITHKFFLDDIESTLNKQYNLKLDLLAKPDQSEIDKLMKSYLIENFRLKSNGKTIKWNYLGSEIEEDAIRCYLEATNIKNLKSLVVTNSSLIETFNDQKNMVHFNFGDNTKSLLLSSDEESGQIQLTE